MQATCPVCFARFAVEAAFTEPEARQLIKTVLELPVRPDLALRYLGCFRPKRRQLAWARANRLVAELDKAMRAGSVRRRGRIWAAPPELWTEAMNTAIARRDEGALDLPFRDHAYLYECVMRASNRREAAEERRIEEERRRPAPPGNGEARPAIDIARASTDPDYDAMEERAREAARLGYPGPWDDRSVRAFLAGQAT